MPLEIDNVTVDYGSVRAVTEVCFEVQTGEVLALLGPSGSGKSTVLRAIAGLEPLAAGRILWDGENVATTPVHRRGFALMFQDAQLFPHETVAGNVGYALRIQRASGIPARVAELLELVGLDGFEKRRVTELSGGEQQRVALARSLAATPRLLLLDEPLSSLDRELRESLAIDIREIVAETGTTAIVVTHDHDEAAVMADRIGVMDQGHLVQLGTLTQLRTAPATERVARFLGVDEIFEEDT